MHGIKHSVARGMNLDATRKTGSIVCRSPQNELGLIMSLRLHHLSQQCVPCCSYSLMPTVQPAASATLNPKPLILTPDRAPAQAARTACMAAHMQNPQYPTPLPHPCPPVCMT